MLAFSNTDYFVLQTITHTRNTPTAGSFSATQGTVLQQVLYNSV